MNTRDRAPSRVEHPVALRGLDSPTVAGAAPDSRALRAHRLPCFTLPGHRLQST
ncbi:protein of unknown function [Pseudomonas sp. JV241A]|nr:protein of unknown function [Pseudomonas sp. JV241A]